MEKNSILVVDDNPGNIHIINTLLEAANYQVHTVTSGYEALETAAKEQPDLILLDIMMPDMDGFETCKQLKEQEQTRDIPVIFLTADNESTSVVKGLELGGVDYLTKPFSSIEVRARIKTHIELRESKETIVRQSLEQQDLLKKLKATIDTAGHSTLDLVKEIDEADDMSKEQLLQKMKLNILEMLIAAGYDNLKGEYDRLNTKARTGEVESQDQASVDALLAQFGL